MGGFVSLNVFAFLFGVLESIFAYFITGSWLSLIWNGLLGYGIAYTLYWVMTCSGNARLMQGGLLFIVLYVAFNIWMTMNTLIFVLPAVLYGAKAFLNLLMLINGYKLLKEVLPEG